jgi:hypothetical protein
VCGPVLGLPLAPWSSAVSRAIGCAFTQACGNGLAHSHTDFDCTRQQPPAPKHATPAACCAPVCVHLAPRSPNGGAGRVRQAMLFARAPRYAQLVPLTTPFSARRGKGRSGAGRRRSRRARARRTSALLPSARGCTGCTGPALRRRSARRTAAPAPPSARNVSPSRWSSLRADRHDAARDDSL